MAPLFDYKAYDRGGKIQKGTIEAETQKAARLKLKKQDLIVTQIQEQDPTKQRSSKDIPFLGGRIGVKDISLMTRQLASLVKANIPLVESLSALVEQTESPKLKGILSQVRQDVNEGSSLAKALRQHPKAFDNIFINMVEAGETSGTLSLVLMRLADFKEAQLRLRNKVISGMTYPALMMAVAVLLLIIIFTFVIPKLTKIFESMNKPVPLTTEVLIFISGTLTEYWYLILTGTLVLFWLFKKRIATPEGRLKWDRFKLKVAIFGPLIRMVAVTRFASTMSTLLGSGVPIITSMNIARNIVDNTVLAKAIEAARENITEGQSIAEPLRRSGEFPPLVIHMIAIGEKTGELPQMLQNVAHTYEEQVNARVESMTALLEPIMIVGMGGVVGFIVMSIFVPLLEISNIN